MINNNIDEAKVLNLVNAALNRHETTLEMYTTKELHRAWMILEISRMMDELDARVFTCYPDKVDLYVDPYALGLSQCWHCQKMFEYDLQYEICPNCKTHNFQCDGCGSLFNSSNDLICPHCGKDNVPF